MKVIILNFSDNKLAISKKILELQEQFNEVVFINPSYRIDLGEEINGLKVNYPYDFISNFEIDESYDLSLERLRQISILEAKNHRDYIDGTFLRRFYSWNYLLAPHMFLWFRFAKLIRIIFEKEKPDKYLVFGEDKDFPWKSSSIQKIAKAISPNLLELSEKITKEDQYSLVELKNFETLTLKGFSISGRGGVSPVRCNDGIEVSVSDGALYLERHDIEKNFEFKFEVCFALGKERPSLEINYVDGARSCKLLLFNDNLHIGVLGIQQPLKLMEKNLISFKVTDNVYSVSLNHEAIFSALFDDYALEGRPRLSLIIHSKELLSPSILFIRKIEVEKLYGRFNLQETTKYKDINTRGNFRKVDKSCHEHVNIFESDRFGCKKRFFLPIESESSIYLDFKILYLSAQRRGVALSITLGGKSYHAIVSNVGVLDPVSKKNLKIKIKDRIKLGILYINKKAYITCRGRFLELTPVEKAGIQCFLEVGIPGVREQYLIRSVFNQVRKISLLRRLKDWTKKIFASNFFIKNRAVLYVVKRFFPQQKFRFEIIGLKISTNKNIQRDILSSFERYSNKKIDFPSEETSTNVATNLLISKTAKKHILLISSPHQSPWIYSQSRKRWVLVDEYLEGVADSFYSQYNSHDVFTTIIYTSGFSDNGARKTSLTKLCPSGFNELYLADMLLEDKKSNITRNGPLTLGDFPLLEEAFSSGLFDADRVSPPDNFFSFLEVFSSTENRAITLYLSFDEIIKNLHPDVVWSGRLDAMPYIFPLAKKYNFLTVASKLGIAEEVIPSYLKYNPDGSLDLTETPDLTFLWGSFTGNYFNSFFPSFPKKVLPIGRSRIDTFYNEGGYVDKASVKKSLGFLADDNVVLFGATIRSTYGKSFNDGDGAVFLGKRAYFATLKTLVNLAIEFNFWILIKPWGGDDIDFISESIQKIGGDRMVLSTNSSDQMHNVEYLSAVDLVVSNISCLFGEATAVKVPVINLAFPEIYYLYGSRRMDAYNKLSFPVHNQIELQDAISSFFNDPSWLQKVLVNSALGMEDIFGKLDGNISHRMVEQVLSEINKTKEV
jgi:hypothetical protein